MTDAEVDSAFAIRLVGDLLSAMVVTGTITKEAADIFVDDVHRSMLTTFATRERRLQEISEALKEQVRGVVAAKLRLLDG